MNIRSFTHDTRAIPPAAPLLHATTPSPARRRFRFVYLGDATLASQCFATSRSIEFIEVVPRPNAVWDWLPADPKSGRALVPDVLFIEHGYPAVDSRAILHDITARQLPVLAVIVAPWDDEFAKLSFTLGAADVVVKSTASFRAAAFRMGRILLERASRPGTSDAARDRALAESVERETAAALALQRAQEQYAAEANDAGARLAAAHAALEALEAKLHGAIAALAQAEHRAEVDRQAAVDDAARRRSEFDAQLAVTTTERQMLAKQLALSAAALRQAEQRHASESAAAADQLAAEKRHAEAVAAKSAGTISELQRTVNEATQTLARVEQHAAAERQAARDAAAELHATFTTELKEEATRRHALATQLSDLQLALTESEDRHRSETAVAAAHFGEQLEKAELQLTTVTAALGAVEAKLHAAEMALQRAEERYASDMSTAATQLAAQKREAEASATKSAALISDLQTALDQTNATLAGVEQRAAQDRQAATDAALERQTEFDRQLAAAATALQHADERYAVELAAAAARLADERSRAEAAATAHAALTSQLQRSLDETAAALAVVEQQAAADRQAAKDDAAQRRAEFETELAQVKQRAAHERQAATDAALERQTEFDRQLADALTAQRRVEERHAFDTAQFAVEKQQAAAQLAAETRRAAAAAAQDAVRIDDLQRTLEDTAATLARVEQQAAADRQAAKDDAARRQATFETELSQEAARVRELTARLSDVKATLAQAAARHHAELNSAVADLVAQRKESETAAANSAATIGQLHRVIDDTTAALARVERQAEADRQATADAADNMEAEFARELEAEIAERQLREKELADAEIALQRAEQRWASDLADASDALRQAETRRDAAAREHRRLFDQAPAGLCRVTSDGTMSLANHAFAQFLGYKTPEQLLKVDLASTVFESADELQWIIKRCFASRRTESIETTWTRKDGSRILVRVAAAATMADEIEMTADDVTPQRVLEEKLRLSQRMEAVARYGAEVAVTCDSLLTHVEQEGRRWLASTSDDAAVRYQGELLFDEVARAAQCMSRLAAYGKEENKVSGDVDLRKILTDLEPVLKRVAGTDVEVVLPREASPLNLDVEAEPVERMLINVAAYGRERMALGGRLTIQVAPIVVDRQFTAKYPNVRPGAHVLLTVNETRNAQRADMAPAGQAQTPAASAPGRRVVDLATLQALVRGCGGHLWMMAAPRGDMTLKIRLPRRMLDDPRMGANAVGPVRWMKRAVSLLT